MHIQHINAGRARMAAGYARMAADCARIAGPNNGLNATSIVGGNAVAHTVAISSTGTDGVPCCRTVQHVHHCFRANGVVCMRTAIVDFTFDSDFVARTSVHHRI